ncbi:MAG: gliding motility-associated C-terminal domain-containing protein [Flavobacteriaceae bacterium]|nr:gliding motility-associated C-terminal domain-containing protein [Flavobacteriaceae bacterium]
MRFLLYFLFFFIITNNCNSQIDTEFWFVAPEVNQNHGDRPIYLKFATYSNSSTIIVSQPANDNFQPIEFQMEANDSYVLDVTDFIDVIENKPSHVVLDYGIKIVSTSEIMVYYEVSPGCNCNPDIFALKGKNALGNFFITPYQSFNNSWSDYFAGFNIVATEDDTEINIVLTQDSEDLIAGEEFSINLNKGQTYFVKVSNNIGTESLSGTTISSNKNISVTIHEDSLTGPYGGCADLVGDQLIPTELLGQEYIAVKGYLFGPDKVYVTAQNDNTDVLIDGDQFATIDALETLEITLANPSVYIYTSEPSYVLHMSGFGCEVGQAILPPLDCTGSYDVSIVRSTSEFFALNILAPAGSEDHFYIEASDLTIDANDFNFVPGSNQNWLYAQLDFTDLISADAAIRVLNSNYRFHMGLIHGGSTSGCRYGYFSDFGEFDSSFTAQTSLCEGSSLEFQGPFVEGAIYSWNGPNGFTSEIQNPVIENVALINQGEYSLEIIVNEVCTSTSSMQIEIIPRPSNFDISEISICDYTIIANLLSDYPGINIYDSPTLSQSLSPDTDLTAGVYYITQLNEFGCESIDALNVFLSCLPIVPNAFSPNIDGFNDHFNIQNLYDVFVNHKLKIYNRYGTLIFEGDNSNKWYGNTINSNEKAPVGTYFYKLNLNNSKNDIITGWVYLNY